MFQIMRGNRRVKRQKLYFDISLPTIVAIVKLYGSVYTYYLTQSIWHFWQYNLQPAKPVKECLKVIQYIDVQEFKKYKSVNQYKYYWSGTELETFVP